MYFACSTLHGLWSMVYGPAMWSYPCVMLIWWYDLLLLLLLASSSSSSSSSSKTLDSSGPLRITPPPAGRPGSPIHSLLLPSFSFFLSFPHKYIGVSSCVWLSTVFQFRKWNEKQEEEEEEEEKCANLLYEHNEFGLVDLAFSWIGLASFRDNFEIGNETYWIATVGYIWISRHSSLLRNDAQVKWLDERHLAQWQWQPRCSRMDKTDVEPSMPSMYCWFHRYSYS